MCSVRTTLPWNVPLALASVVQVTWNLQQVHVYVLEHHWTLQQEGLWGSDCSMSYNPSTSSPQLTGVLLVMVVVLAMLAVLAMAILVVIVVVTGVASVPGVACVVPAMKANVVSMQYPSAPHG
jgi:hypothetical protein